MQTSVIDTPEIEKTQFGSMLLSQTYTSGISSKNLLNLFFDIKLSDYLDFLSSTGLYYKESYLKETLKFLESKAKEWPTLKQQPLTVGTLVFLARLMCDGSSIADEDAANKIVVKLILQPINILTERRRCYG